MLNIIIWLVTVLLWCCTRLDWFLSARLAWFWVRCYMRECVCRHPSCIVKFDCTLWSAPCYCIALSSLLMPNCTFCTHQCHLFSTRDKAKMWKICSYGSTLKYVRNKLGFPWIFFWKCKPSLQTMGGINFYICS